jgi:hypothetical protein
MHRSLRFVAIATIALAPSGPSYAQDPGGIASDGCDNAIAHYVQRKVSNATRVSTEPTRINRVNGHQTGVTGSGFYKTRSGQTKFTWSCVYDLRSHKTSALNFKVRGGGGGNSDVGAAVGAAVGTIIGSAIIGAMSNDDKRHQGYNSGYSDPPDDGGGAMSGAYSDPQDDGGGAMSGAYGDTPDDGGGAMGGSDSFSPASGVVCYPAQSACYYNGSFDPGYTSQYFG